jgi:hypothetical protein
LTELKVSEELDDTENISAAEERRLKDRYDIESRDFDVNVPPAVSDYDIEESYFKKYELHLSELLEICGAPLGDTKLGRPDIGKYMTDGSWEIEKTGKIPDLSIIDTKTPPADVVKDEDSIRRCGSEQISTKFIRYKSFETGRSNRQVGIYYKYKLFFDIHDLKKYLNTPSQTNKDAFNIGNSLTKEQLFDYLTGTSVIAQIEIQAKPAGSSKQVQIFNCLVSWDNLASVAPGLYDYCEERLSNMKFSN